MGAAGFFCIFFPYIFLFERTRPAASMRPPCLIYLSTSIGVRTGCHYLISPSVCQCVYVASVVFIDCESCSRPISTNPGSMAAGEGGRTSGTWFISRRLEVGTVAVLLWISWCALGAAGFRVFFRVFFFERTRPAASMRPLCLIYLATRNEGRPRERATEDVFCP